LRYHCSNNSNTARTEAILDCLKLPSRAPPTAAAVPDAEEWAADFDATL
jgi:hypothetical protein